MPEPFVYTSDRLRVLFGCGTAARIAAEAEHHKMERVMLLCSRGRAELAQRIAAPLGARVVGTCDAARGGMPAAAFDEIVGELTRHAADGFICVGGGSPIGLAKAAGAATEVPFIAVVTTYSGSEMSNRWYLGAGVDERSGRSPAALPATAIYDPELTRDLPFATSAASCMNAMAHAVESLYGPGANPIVLALAEEAVRLIGGALPRLEADPRDLAARTDALYAAWLAAAFRTPVGLSHTVAQRVRQNFGTEHARTHAAVLPYAVAFNRPASPAGMERIARALAARDPAQALYDINIACGLATGLKDLGMREEDIPRAVEIVAKRTFPNPRTPTRADIEAVLRQAFAGQPPRF
ncbi:MAG TPA: maleylacetate reductase [Xanthobacteraceae bacterium]|jgi:maleylacetate reductase